MSGYLCPYCARGRRSRSARPPWATRSAVLLPAVGLGVEGLKDGRQSKVHLRMIASELDQELRRRFPGEETVIGLEDALRAV